MTLLHAGRRRDRRERLHPVPGGNLFQRNRYASLCHERLRGNSGDRLISGKDDRGMKSIIGVAVQSMQWAGRKEADTAS